jgi:hypothetical protein
MSGRSYNQLKLADENVAMHLIFESHRCIKVQSKGVKKVNSLENIQNSLGMLF